MCRQPRGGTWGANIKYYIGNHAARKNAQHKLNSYGYLVGHCGIVNNTENMKRMKEQLVMADSIAEKQQKNKAYNEKVPASVRNFEERGRHVGKLTVGDIESI
jgi:hypothetical protein